MRPVSVLFLIALATVPPRADAGFACSFVSSDKAAAVEIEGRRYALPVGLDNCEGAKVVSGEATACVIDTKGRTVCRAFEAGESLTEDRLVEKRGVSDMFLAVLAMLKGDNTPGSAVSRAVVPPGFPEGRVLLIPPRLRLDLSDPAMRGATAIEFREGAFNGPVVERIDQPGTVAELSVTPFRRNQRYFWIIRGAPAGLAPVDFSVASKDELERAREAFAEIEADLAAGVLGRAVMKADWLKRENYTFDAAEILRAAGLELNR